MKAHHVEILEKTLHSKDAFVLPPELISGRESFIERHGCSSPHLRWENINDRTEFSSEKVIPGPSVTDNLLRHIDSNDVLAVHDLIISLNADWPQPYTINPAFDGRDPSSYVAMATAWEIVMRADQCMRHIYVKYRGGMDPHFLILVDRIVATAVSPLSEVGAPSWGEHRSSQVINRFWQETFSTACSRVLNASGTSQIERPSDLGYDHWISTYARFSVLRAAYYTIMMRAAHDLGPGLTEESKIDTALAYMA